MLCKFCKKIQPPRHQPKTKGEKQHSCITRHHANFDALISSANQGCELCNLFRRCIESAQLNRKRSTAGKTGSDDGSSNDNNSHYNSDPFEELYLGLDIAERPKDVEIKFRATRNTGYWDVGDRYYWFDEWSNEQAIHSNIDRWRAISKILEKEEVEDKKAGIVLAPKASHAGTSEIMQWLFQQDHMRFGPEQIWVRGCTDFGPGWPIANDNYDLSKNRERSTIITLSAGSLEATAFGIGSEYCVDNEFVASTTALAIQLPCFWEQKYISLYATDKESGSCKDWPVFEFYQRRGICAIIVVHKFAPS